MSRSLVTPVAAGLVAAGLVVAGCGSAPTVADRRADQAAAVARDAGLPDDVADLLGTAARAATARYRVVYPRARSGEDLVITNDGADRRIDVVSGGVVTEIQAVVDGQAFACTRAADATEITSCERTDAVVDPPGVFAAETIDDTTTALRQRLDDFTFDVESRTLVGAEVRCLVTRRRTGRDRDDLAAGGTLCLSEQGVVLLVDQDGERLEAVSYGTDVPPDAFDLPGR